MSDEIQIWRTRSKMHMVCVYAEDVPTALRALAFALETKDEQDLVAEIGFGLSDDEGYFVTATIEEAFPFQEALP